MELFHRAKRPVLERNIIDTSERACANYRYVIGQHFWHVNIYKRAQRTCNLRAEFENLRVGGLSARSALNVSPS